MKLRNHKDLFNYVLIVFEISGAIYNGNKLAVARAKKREAARKNKLLPAPPR